MSASSSTVVAFASNARSSVTFVSVYAPLPPFMDGKQKPSMPSSPSNPGGPIGPIGPVGPRAPAGPGGPGQPLSPSSPSTPNPGGPIGPRGSNSATISSTTSSIAAGVIFPSSSCDAEKCARMSLIRFSNSSTTTGGSWSRHLKPKGMIAPQYASLDTRPMLAL